MEFDGAWARPTEKLEDKGKEKLLPHPQPSVHPTASSCSPSLKKIQLLPLSDGVSAASLPASEIVPVLSPSSMIKPPPTIFIDLWGEIENPPPEHPADLQTCVQEPGQVTEECQNTPVSEDTLIVPREQNIAPIPLKQEDTVDGLWQKSLEEISEDWAEQTTTSFDEPTLFDDLDLFDIDATLAKQEIEIQQQEYERAKEITDREKRFEKWGGVFSLIYVNWENSETAEQDALRRLGYTNIALSEETRAFIIQAARNARLPHRQEIQLTTRLANARLQQASLPLPDEEDAIDLHAAERQALQAEIAKIEQTLTSKMQWVAIKKAAQFLGQGVDLDDLIQFGIEGVIAGIRHFDITRKARLLVAVNMWTFQAITRAIADHGSVVRLPAHMFEQVRAIEKQRLQWRREYGKLPTHQELAQVMDIPLKDLLNIFKAKEILKASKDSLSIERLVQAEYLNEGYSFQEVEGGLFANDDLFANILGELTGQQIKESFYKGLTPRERRVFSLRAGLNGDSGDGEEHTLEEIGQALDITRERVRQIEQKARKKMLRSLWKIQREPSVLERAEKAVSDQKDSHQKKRKEKIERNGSENNNMHVSKASTLPQKPAKKEHRMSHNKRSK